MTETQINRTQQRAPKEFKTTPLELEKRATLPTPEAAYHLNRAQQTLRTWALRNDGPIKCFRVHGRLQWPTAEIKRALGITA